jgi:hypothetical protein
MLIVRSTSLRHCDRFSRPRRRAECRYVSRCLRPAAVRGRHAPCDCRAGLAGPPCSGPAAAARGTRLNAPNRAPPSARRPSHPAWFAARINVYGIALTTLWTPLNVVLLPDRVAALVPATSRASALGTFTRIGIGLAVVVQPVDGRISDLAPFPDRRRPFILLGSAIDVVCLGLLWLAPDLLWLLAAYLLLQVSANFAQAAFQALIPDLIRPAELGLASGIKNAFDVVGSALGLVATAVLLGLGPRHAAVFAFIAGALSQGAALSAPWVPRIPLLPPAERAPIGAVLARLASLPGTFVRDFRAHRAFALAVAAKLLLLLGIYPIQRFFLYFLQNRFGVAGAVRETSLETARCPLAVVE